MRIQWFPGHMTKSLRMMGDSISSVDCVAYLLDARAPLSCLNPSFNSILEGLPCLFVLNKSDLADSVVTNQWLAYFRKKYGNAISVCSVASKSKREITTALQALKTPKLDRLAQRGVNRPRRAMIVGVPNCGKSTLINCLASGGLTKTGDKPGVTRGKQWVRLASGLELLDTPGTLWSKFEDQSVALNLCYIGSIRDEVVDVVELAQCLLETLVASYPQLVEKRYGITAETSSLLDAVCKKRLFYISNAQPDYLRAANAVLDDFRKGRLGQISLERVENLSEESQV